MFDGAVRKVIDPGLNRAGHWFARRRVGADMMTVIGLGFGLTAAAMIAGGCLTLLALVPLLASRLADGLDGAIARATQKTDFGGYLDIVADFAFYGAIPLAFVIRDPEMNGIAGAVLLTSFYVNGTSFLGYAVLAEKHGMTTRSRGEKSLYFTAGLLEGSETIAFFAFICLWPQAFAVASYVFAALCFVTAVSRLLLARDVFRAP